MVRLHAGQFLKKSPPFLGGVFFGKLSYGDGRIIFAMWYLYICKKEDRLYTGITVDVNNRLGQHGRPELIYREEFSDKITAAKRERQIKGWSRKKKLKLAHGKNNPVSLP